MATEVERKYIVIDDSFLREGVVTRVRKLHQGYPKISACALRFQHIKHIWPAEMDEGRITVKSAKPGKKRAEYEYPIPAADALELLDRFCGAGRVWKTRADVLYEGQRWEIDIYRDELTGLMMCEIEFEGGREHDFARPPWLGPEVTGKAPYYNQNLAQFGWPVDYTDQIDHWEQTKAMAEAGLARLKTWSGTR